MIVRRFEQRKPVGDQPSDKHLRLGGRPNPVVGSRLVVIADVNRDPVGRDRFEGCLVGRIVAEIDCTVPVGKRRPNPLDRLTLVPVDVRPYLD